MPFTKIPTNDCNKKRELPATHWPSESESVAGSKATVFQRVAWDFSQALLSFHRAQSDDFPVLLLELSQQDDGVT